MLFTKVEEHVTGKYGTTDKEKSRDILLSNFIRERHSDDFVGLESPGDRPEIALSLELREYYEKIARKDKSAYYSIEDIYRPFLCKVRVEFDIYRKKSQKTNQSSNFDNETPIMRTFFIENSRSDKSAKRIVNILRSRGDDQNLNYFVKNFFC
jgi:hypothetical protein